MIVLYLLRVVVGEGDYLGPLGSGHACKPTAATQK